MSRTTQIHSFPADKMALAMVKDFTKESLSFDPIHGYIPFISPSDTRGSEISEQEIIDHPWVQRMRHIHQLQTAWWVFPSAEHMRFQHILGAMHLASKAIDLWYDSLCESCANVPSRGYVESLVRMAALLHDVGHGPFGHFFDDHYLDQFGITHETLGAHIIQHELGDLLRGIRRNPNGHLQPLEELEPRQIAWLICRPRPGDPDSEGQPDWLEKLRALFSGIYMVDNMDFVLRDAYMSGYNTRAFDISRLMYYTFFTPSGLTIHSRGLPTLINFIETRANLFKSIYFHRTVRAFDLALEDLFGPTMKALFFGNPLEHLDEYLHFTESSFMVDVQRLRHSNDSEKQALGRRWEDLLSRRVTWKLAAERTLNFHSTQSERMTIFSAPELIERLVRERLPHAMKTIPMKIDIARHYHRPSGKLPTGGQNYMLDPNVGEPQMLNDDELFQALPVSFLIFRIYSLEHDHDGAIHQALHALLGETGDTKTNM